MGPSNSSQTTSSSMTSCPAQVANLAAARGHRDLDTLVDVVQVAFPYAGPETLGDVAGPYPVGHVRTVRTDVAGGTRESPTVAASQPGTSRRAEVNSVHAIVGRNDEVEVLAAFVADEEREPRALLIEGEPGIGKTTLWQHLQASAAERGWVTLAHRPVRSEMDLSYAGLVELLDGIDGTVVSGLPAPQARVLRMVLRKEEPDEAFDRLSLSLAVVTALRAMADRPVLLAVDDVQWLDPPMARALVFVARRMGGTALRVALVRSVNGWSPPTDPDPDDDEADAVERPIREGLDGASGRAGEAENWLAEVARRCLPSGWTSCGSARSDRAGCPGSCAGRWAGCRPGRGWSESPSCRAATRCTQSN